MGDVSMEKRMRLLKQIRTRYNEDQYDLSNRELLLYGKSSRSAERPERAREEDFPPVEGQVSFFRLRVALAAGLLGLVILMDMNGIRVAGITADEIFQAISADFEYDIQAWAEASQPQPAP